jgi:hypothetical protein
LILFGRRITTLGTPHPEVSAVAVREGKFLAIGSDGEVLALRGPATRVIDLGGRRVIPGLNDTHLHLIRGGLNFNLELRWDGVPSLADALRMLREQAGPWFSSEDGQKGAIQPGQLAYLAVLSDDYFAVDAERIKGIESVLTVVDGKVVNAAEPFADFAPPPLPVSPDWSPAGVYGGYGAKGHAECGFLHRLEGLLSTFRRPCRSPPPVGRPGLRLLGFLSPRDLPQPSPRVENFR